MSALSIFFLFLRIGAFTFGGGIVMLGFIEKELRATGHLSDEEISDMMVLATAFPGPVAVNMSFLAGKRVAGVAGAAWAVAGTVLPPFLVILLLSGLLVRYMGEPRVSSFFLGASCAVAVIIGQVVFNMARSSGDGWRDACVIALTAALILAAGVHPFIALASGVLFRLILGGGGR